MPKTYTAAGSATAGDVYTASAHNVIVTDVNNLIVPASVAVYNTSATTCANNTFTRISWNQSAWDTDSMKGAGTVTGLTIGTTGLYLITAHMVFDTNAVGQRLLVLDKGTSSSVTTVMAGTSGSPTNGNYADVAISTTYALTAGDTIQLFAWQSTGGNLNVLAGTATGRYFTATWIGRTS